MKDQGKFEIAKFHGMTVAIFDSHWFANRIIESDGTEYMCRAIERTACNKLPNGSDDKWIDCDIDCSNSMMPYRDFMAVHRIENSRVDAGVFLKDIFTMPKDEAFPALAFRLETARRMMAAPPIRYCIPFTVKIY